MNKNINEFKESDGIFTSQLLKSLEQAINIVKENRDDELCRVLYNLIDSFQNAIALDKQEQEEVKNYRLSCSKILKEIQTRV